MSNKTFNNGWDGAIEKATDDLRIARERVSRLQAALRTFQQRLAEGEPFPGAAEQGIDQAGRE